MQVKINTAMKHLANIERLVSDASVLSNIDRNNLLDDIYVIKFHLQECGGALPPKDYYEQVEKKINYLGSIPFWVAILTLIGVATILITGGLN